MIRKRRGLSRVLAVMLCLMLVFACFIISKPANAEETVSVEHILYNMTLEERISQLIIPSIRTWNGQNVLQLSDNQELAEALQKHQYGGVILYGENVSDTEQITKLISQLQYNNSQINASTKIPYFVSIDEEGGIVTRLTNGTRMNGNMAIGATGDNAEENAKSTGLVIGEELAAIGVNVDFAPDIDVNNNPANPVIGTRSFSDDPQIVAKLGVSYTLGLSQNHIIGTYKHFPGHGDTDTDTHIGTATVNKTLEEMKQCELVPFASAIENGAEMIMTAHITLPKIDDEMLLGDGSTGYYPATMSHKIITDILRTEMGYDGVIVTDALNMESVASSKLVEGEAGSVEYAANIGEKVLNAGCDLLLVPVELTTTDAVSKLDAYIEQLMYKVNMGYISIDRINESVTRVLELKEKYGILTMDTSGSDIDKRVQQAKKILGSSEHHETEWEIAEDAITLVKNDNRILPLSGYSQKIVLVGREKADNVNLQYIITDLQKKGLIDPTAYVVNLAAGTTSGSPGAATQITIGYYYDAGSDKTAYSDDLKAAVSSANTVIAVTKTTNAGALASTSPQYQGVQAMMTDASANDASFIILSDNLPYDAARYQNADAIVLAYMGSGMNTDPTSELDTNAGAYNANVVVAAEMMFDASLPQGRLPVNIPTITVNDDGSISYTDSVLYPRGFGLSYNYQFTSGVGSTYKEVDGGSLSFQTNAREENRTKVLVDNVAIAVDQYTASGMLTKLGLSSGFLNTLSEGQHILTLAYDYGNGEFSIHTGFTVDRIDQKWNGGNPGDQGITPTRNDNSWTQSGTGSTTSNQSVEADAKTNDENQSLLWIVLALAAVSVISGVLAVRTKKTNRR